MTFSGIILYHSISETKHLEAEFVAVYCRVDQVHSSHPHSILHQHKVVIVLSFNTGSITWDIFSNFCVKPRSPGALSVSLPKILHPFHNSCIFTFLPSTPHPHPLIHPSFPSPPYVSTLLTFLHTYLSSCHPVSLFPSLPICLSGSLIVSYLPHPCVFTSLTLTKLHISKEHIPL